MKLNETVYSVSDLARQARLLLEHDLSGISVEGEISNLARPASGHIYFTLKDDKAQIQCAMFKGQLNKLPYKPENGQQVILIGNVSLYEPRGNFQIIANRMVPAGDGLLQQQFEAIKKQLERDGLFDQTHKQDLPPLPQHLGVVTSPSGAAIHDIISVLKKRFPLLPIIIYPTSVQGDDAAQNIVQAIETANKRKECDVLIVARGGGSMEDLWSFNDTVVAQAIFQSRIPIISAVGHETDFTIADFVADVRSPTPSAAAELVSPDQQHVLHQLSQQQTRLHQLMSHHVFSHQQKLLPLHHRLKQAHPYMQLNMHQQRLDEIKARLPKAMTNIMSRLQFRLSASRHALVEQRPLLHIKSKQQQCDRVQHRLAEAIKHLTHQQQLRFTKATRALETLSPLATLSRGYSIVKHQTSQTVVDSIQQLQTTKGVTVQLKDGQFDANIKKIYDEH